jgi:hypothetical protein
MRRIEENCLYLINSAVRDAILLTLAKRIAVRVSEDAPLMELDLDSFEVIMGSFLAEFHESP